MIYECIKEFYVEKYDDDGFHMDYEPMVIEKGSKWQADAGNYRIVGGRDSIHLDKISGNAKEWLEITKDTLEKYFKEVTYEAS